MTVSAIWLKLSPPASPYVLAQYCFHLDGAVSRAQLRCASTGAFMLGLNGKELARGLSHYGPHSVWHVFDLCSGLLTGDNEIQLLVESLTDSANWLMVNGFAITEGDKKTTIAS